MPTWESAPTSGGGDENGDGNTGGGEAGENGTAGGNGTSNGNGNGTGTLSDQELEELERTLEESIGTFDGDILAEQENARDKTGNVGSNGRRGTTGGLADIGEFETYEGSGASNTVSGNAGRGQGQGEVDGERVNDGPPPSPDDDIVARQIREAAQRESDPQQRAILWKEYERYKAGI